MKWIAGTLLLCCQMALGAAPLHESTSPDAALQRRFFVGYYPSWLDAANAGDEGARAKSGLATVPSAYSHIVIAFAQPDFSWSGDMTSWAGSGLSFRASPVADRTGHRHAAMPISSAFCWRSAGRPTRTGLLSQPKAALGRRADEQSPSPYDGCVGF